MVMMYVRFPLSLRNVEALLLSLTTPKVGILQLDLGARASCFGLQKIIRL